MTKTQFCVGVAVLVVVVFGVYTVHVRIPRAMDCLHSGNPASQVCQNLGR